MPKPRGAIGATKMKIMAVICNNGECHQESYGYGIWQTLKENFHIYLNDKDVRNVYHHLNDLCILELINRVENKREGSRCLYKLTDEGHSKKQEYKKYLKIQTNDNRSINRFARIPCLLNMPLVYHGFPATNRSHWPRFKNQYPLTTYGAEVDLMRLDRSAFY